METFIFLIFCGLVFWVCWRWFLRNWVMSSPIAHSIQGRFSASKISDEAYYAQAAHEVKNKIISDGLWAKAWSDAQGDEVKAQAFYLKYRVEDLKRQAAGKFSEFAKDYNDDPGKVVIPCPQCAAKLRVAAGRHLDVRCPKCGTSFRTITLAPPLKNSYGANFARYIYAVGACLGIFLVFSLIIGLARGSGALIIGAIGACMLWACIAAWNAIVKPNEK